MKSQRIKELRAELEAERISMDELIEIDGAFAELPDEFLSEDRENALAADQLNELERWNDSHKVESVPMDVLSEMASAIVERQFFINSKTGDEHSFTDENGDIRYIESVQDEFNVVLDILDEIANPEI